MTTLTTRPRFYAGVGARKTPPAMLTMMTGIGAVLARRGYVLRSGGAEGADQAFAAGAGDKADIILPWTGFNGQKGRAVGQFANVDYLEECASHAHPAWDRLGGGVRKLMTRNAALIIGDDGDAIVDFVVAWTEEGKPVGGTGHAIRLAWSLGIPVINLWDVQGDPEDIVKTVILRGAERAAA